MARYHCIPKTLLASKYAITSVKSIKYLHSPAHEALDVWQLHTEEDKTPHSACLGSGAHWSLSGDRTWVQGQQRQQAVTSEDTEHYDLEACYDVTQVCTTPLPPPRWPHNPRMAGPADAKWRQHNMNSVETSYS